MESNILDNHRVWSPDRNVRPPHSRYAQPLPLATGYELPATLFPAFPAFPGEDFKRVG